MMIPNLIEERNCFILFIVYDWETIDNALIHCKMDTAKPLFQLTVIYQQFGTGSLSFA